MKLNDQLKEFIVSGKEFLEHNNIDKFFTYLTNTDIATYYDFFVIAKFLIANKITFDNSEKIAKCETFNDFFYDLLNSRYYFIFDLTGKSILDVLAEFNIEDRAYAKKIFLLNGLSCEIVYFEGGYPYKPTSLKLNYDLTKFIKESYFDLETQNGTALDSISGLYLRII